MKKYKEPILFLAIICGIFGYLAMRMGLSNMLNTMMNTAYRLLMDTAFYLLAISVVMSAFAQMLNEFGVVNMLNRLLSPLMRPIYNLPGAASLGIVLTYLTDNPAILSIADNKEYRSYFKTYQMPALTNLGTSFGMGLIVTTFVMGIAPHNGENLVKAALFGNLGAVIGSVISTRIMLHFCKKRFGAEDSAKAQGAFIETKQDEKKSVGARILGGIIDGGAKGVELGLSIIPGVLIVCTFVFMITNGPSESGAYTGAAYEGIGLLPQIAQKLNFILQPLFGFSSPKAISVPITSLGAAGASLSIMKTLYTTGFANAHDIAVFVSMAMCWSGYLSTHVSMMNSLGYKEMTGKAILSHTIGGLCAGIITNWLFALII
ncbi:MAG: hypothetical protein SPL05_00505 [Eubacteriales bacterium]|nr:hypothetical protein [Eubacteriales bacterium]